MRIAIVGIRFDNRGGSERRARQLVAGLLERGHEVEIFADTINDTEGLDVVTHILKSSGISSYHKIADFTGQSVKALSTRTDIDVIHNQIRPFVKGVVSVGGGCHASYLDRRASTSGLIKRAALTLNPFHRFVLELESRMYSHDGCPAVITNSNMSKRDILRHYDYPPERVHVAYNGVDSDKFSPMTDEGGRAVLRRRLGFEDDETVVLFVGSDFGRKGLGSLIDALAGLDGYRLLVVGRGDEAAYQAMAGKAGLKGPVFTGPVPDALDYYRAADAYCLPTIYDPFANTTLEAMACGLPVITTLDNGVSEIITDGTDGFIVSGADTPGSIRSILKTLTSVDLRLIMGAKARARVSSLTWDNALEKVLRVYDTVQSMRSGRP